MFESLTPSFTPTFSVRRVEDVPFRKALTVAGQLETLHLDIYEPEDDSSALRPVVLWFHGGGFRPGNDKRQVYIPRFANAFAACGYVGIAPDYRVRANVEDDPSGAVRDAVTDARAALAWTQTHSAAYRIDPQRVILAGGSAGGMTVLNLVHTFGQPLQGVLAVLDLWGTPPSKFRLYSQLNPATPPTFIVHGTADQLVAYELSQNYAADLQQVGVPCELFCLPGAPHTPLQYFEQIAAAAGVFLSKVLMVQA